MESQWGNWTGTPINQMFGNKGPTTKAHTCSPPTVALFLFQIMAYFILISIQRNEKNTDWPKILSLFPPAIFPPKVPWLSNPEFVKQAQSSHYLCNSKVSEARWGTPVQVWSNPGAPMVLSENPWTQPDPETPSVSVSVQKQWCRVYTSLTRVISVAPDCPKIPVLFTHSTNECPDEPEESD